MSLRIAVMVALVGSGCGGCAGPAHDTPLGSNVGACTTTCDGGCADLLVDSSNCGACGAACAPGFVCAAGTCALSCQAGALECGGSCRDPMTDRANCGTCGHACGAGEVCAAGQCALSCPASLVECGGTCRDFMTDRASCGTCGHSCGAGEVCAAGQCVLSCEASLTECGGSCRDFMTDRANCGSCGHACGAGEVCTAGQCALSCPASLTECGGTCRDFTNDRANCGSCGHVCAAGELCSSSQCVASCLAPLKVCGLACRDLQHDPSNCGDCGVSCASGQSCVDGHCGAACVVGDLQCATGCINPATSVTHCGATSGCGLDGGTAGVSCAPGEACSSGVCVSVCLAQPPLGAERRERLALAANPRPALGDVNGDGRRDVVAADYAQNEVVVLLSRPDGGLEVSNRFPLAAGSTPTAAALADVTHDGRLDLLVTEFGLGFVSIRPGNGDGGFGAPLTVSVAGPVSLAAGDVNGDGLLDVAVGTHPSLPPTDDKVMLLLGLDGGAFSTTSLSFATNGYPLSMAMGDLNHDGRAELAVANFGGVAVSLYAGSDGGLSAPTLFDGGAQLRGVALGDVDGDAELDLVSVSFATKRITTLFGAGDGTFNASTAFTLGTQPVAAAIGDVDGDMKPDLVITDLGAVWVARGQAGRTFAPGVKFPVSGFALHPLLADLDTDGQQDVIVALPQGDLTVLRSVGAGVLRNQTGHGAHLGPSSVVVRDFNRDGLPDVVVGNAITGDLTTMLGRADGGFLLAHGTDGGLHAALNLASADLNDDGTNDVVAAGLETITLLLGQHDGSLVRTATIAAPLGPWAFVVDDFDRSGKPDVAFTALQAVAVRTQQGALTQVYSVDGGAQQLTQLVAGDVDEDGAPDLVVDECGASSALRVLLGNADATFQPGASLASAGCATALGVGDFNLDGHLDLVASPSGSPIELRIGNGDGTFGPLRPVTLPTGVEVVRLEVVDLDGDARPDLVLLTQSATHDAVRVLLGNGDGTFTVSVEHTLATGALGFAVADVTRDGRLDVVVAESVVNALTVLPGQLTCGP